MSLTSRKDKIDGRRGRANLPLLLVLLLLASCSDKSLSLFFDVPPSAPKEAAGNAETSEANRSKGSQIAVPGTGGAITTADAAMANEDRPEIEAVLDWEAAEAMLPKSAMGSIDWMAALDQGTIKLRPKPGGAEAPAPFDLDFFLKGPDPSFDAWFPHSAHTRMMDCKTCHTTTVRYRDNQITMGDLYEGKYCARCHGKVAFGLEECTRCHLDM